MKTWTKRISKNKKRIASLKNIVLKFSSQCGLFVLLVCLSLPGNAEFILKVKNQNGEPVENAVVAIKTSGTKAKSEKAIMDQVAMQFDPRVLIITNNQPVQFPNSDNIRHHVYSFSKPKVFEIKLFKGASLDPVVFDQAGLVILGCNIHDNMIAYIYVSENDELALKTDENGMVKFPGAAPKSVNLWHENLSANHIQRKEYAIDPKNLEKEKTLVIELQKDIIKRSKKHTSFGTFKAMRK